MTYKKIAELAGVSLSTVSKAMSGSSEISPATAERILRIAEENHVTGVRYHKNTADLRVAVTVPEIVSVFYSQNVTDLVSELEKSGIDAAVYITGFDKDKTNRLLTRLAESGTLDGIIVVSFIYRKRAPIPVISKAGVDHGEQHLGGDLISIDIRGGMLEALTHLKELGHTEIGFIGEKNTTHKQEIFLEIADRLGIAVNPRHVFVSSKRFQDIGYEAAEHFIHMRKRPTALIAAYDEVAMGAIHAFRANGIDVPGDISVIGINDIPFAAYANPPLTTIRTYQKENARLTVQKLLERIESDEAMPLQQIQLKCDLIVRETTAPPKER
ncbi:MAG: LacI family DNA-binding transcriptional regulator [Clostridia bacterium]|nr:LacI family DNA-binding transcriptional regulator [Clostridia bacterium]